MANNLIEIFGEKLHRNGAIKEVKSELKRITATVIFLHGSGGSGVEMRDHLEMFKPGFYLPDGVEYIRFLFPSAPVKEYTAIFGQKSRVWHDRMGIHTSLPEMKKSVDEQAQDLKVFIENLVKAGTPLNRIAIGGFSMGGGMALHIAYRYFPQIAGCFTLSSFLHNDSMVYEAVQNETNKDIFPPLLVCHGDKDYTVPIEWGKEMFERLKSSGIKAEFHTIGNTCHELNHDEIDILYDWFRKVLPPKSGRSTTPTEPHQTGQS